MATFGSNWKNDSNGYDDINMFSHWNDDDFKTDVGHTKTVDEILDEIDISLIERYLRKKKLNNINKKR
jgi:hypothetical protein